MKINEINKLGRELELYTYVDYIGKGFPIILPKGSKIIEIIRNYVEAEEEKNGYQMVRTPSVSRAEIYKIEDRLELHKRDMFIIESDDEIENQKEENSIVLRPYVSPFHCAVYKTKQRSYKSLPIKYSETSTVFRNEKDIRGLNKTRQITMSDASIFTKVESLQEQIKFELELTRKFIKRLGLDVRYELANWDDNKKEEYIGTIKEWDYAINSMKSALEEAEIEYKFTQNAKMYGPSIQIFYGDKEFSSLQIDFEIVHRFDLKYVNKNNEEEFPIYIHRTAIGSYENLLGTLIEKYQGNFPLWMAPEQVVVISEDDEYNKYAKEIICKLLKKGIRAEEDTSDNNIQNKEYRAIDLKIPYIIKIGKDQFKNNTINVRCSGDIRNMKLEELILEINTKITNGD